MESDLILIIVTALVVLSAIICVSVFTLKSEVELLKETLEEEMEYTSERLNSLEERVSKIEVIVDGRPD